MKNQDLMFYAISIFTLCLLALIPLALEFSADESFAGNAILQEWIETGDQFALSKN